MSKRDELLNATITEWQEAYSESLSRQDAAEILANVSGYFRLLAKWASEEPIMTTTGAGRAPGGSAASASGTSTNTRASAEHGQSMATGNPCRQQPPLQEVGDAGTEQLPNGLVYNSIFRKAD